jgi:glycosyltransferase involved in cell wall biosynthesis
VTLGFVGFVREWHGLDRVISALAAGGDDPVLRFTIVGDGPARPELERHAVALKVADRVEFTGLRPREAYGR